MIDEQSSASGHDYASDHSAIGAGFDELQGNLMSGCENGEMLNILLPIDVQLTTTWRPYICSSTSRMAAEFF